MSQKLEEIYSKVDLDCIYKDDQHDSDFYEKQAFICDQYINLAREEQQPIMKQIDDLNKQIQHLQHQNQLLQQKKELMKNRSTVFLQVADKLKNPPLAKQ